jgi:hypothetical protein
MPQHFYPMKSTFPVQPDSASLSICLGCAGSMIDKLLVQRARVKGASSSRGGKHIINNVKYNAVLGLLCTKVRDQVTLLPKLYYWASMRSPSSRLDHLLHLHSASDFGIEHELLLTCHSSYALRFQTSYCSPSPYPQLASVLKKPSFAATSGSNDAPECD